MISLATIFDNKLPYPLGEMAKDAFIYSSYDMGYTAERIHQELHLNDMTRLMDKPMWYLIQSQFEWIHTKEGFEFWLTIKRKLEQIEQQ